MQRIVLAYSGSADTSAAIAGLRAQYAAEVIALTLDFGQGRALETIRDRALAVGAARAHVLDVREEFAREFVLPSLKAGALANGRLVLAHALTWPLIARKLVEIAAIERADAVAHGGRGHQAAPDALDALIAATSPALAVVPAESPRVDRMESSAEATGTAPTSGRGCHAVTNLWGRTIECPGEPPESMFTLTRPAADCPAEAAVVDVAFERGTPRAINGVAMPLMELIASLGTIAGAHGVGRVRLDGGASEAPAALLLHAAHRELQRRLADPALDAFAESVSGAYVGIIREGRWFTPLRGGLDAFVDHVQERITGSVRMKLLNTDLVTL